MGMFLYSISYTSATTPTVADCTHAAELHDQEMRRHLDKIAEQGEIIAAYKYRLSMYDNLFPREVKP
jgi:hypothetical protein